MGKREFNPGNFSPDPHRLLGPEGRSRMRRLDNHESDQAGRNDKPPRSPQAHGSAGIHDAKNPGVRTPGQPNENSPLTPEDPLSALHRKVSDAAYFGGFTINAPHELNTLLENAHAAGLTADQLSLSEAMNFIRRSETEHRVSQAIALVTPEDLATDAELATTIRGYVEAAPATTTLEDIVASAKEERSTMLEKKAAEELDAILDSGTAEAPSQSSQEHEGMRKAAARDVLNTTRREEAIINRRLGETREKTMVRSGERNRVEQANEIIEKLRKIIDSIRTLESAAQAPQYVVEELLTEIKALQVLDTDNLNDWLIKGILDYCYNPNKKTKAWLLKVSLPTYREGFIDYTPHQSKMVEKFNALEDVRFGKNYNYQTKKMMQKGSGFFPNETSVASLRPGPKPTADNNKKRATIKRRQQKLSRQAERDQESFPE